jgi:response regulator RpfG family c-di-GMP phosphodiesterase
MDGIEVLNHIREKDRDLAIIILTGYPSVESAVASLKGGVSDYVQKQGWATMPGEKKPDTRVAEECARRIMALEK